MIPPAAELIFLDFQFSLGNSANYFKCLTV